MATFSTRLRELRNSKDLTLEDLANILGTTKSTISRYENELRIPNSDFINAVADFFNVSTDYLLGKSDIKNPYTKEALPKEFNSPEEAMKFILEQPTLMDYGGYSLDEMTEEEILDLANDLLFAMKLALEKRKNK